MTQGVSTPMTINEFLKLEIQDQIAYLNERLEEGITVTEIRNEIGIGEKKLQRLLKDNGYKFNQKSKRYENSSKVKYKSSEVITVKNENSNPLGVINVDDKLLLNIMAELNDMKHLNKKVVEMYEWYEKQRNVIELKQLIIKSRNDMKQMNTKVVELYEWYEKQINVIEPEQLIINSRENNSTTVKSYKVYCETEKAFQALCKKYSHLKVQDLVSKALDEFIEKYK